MRVDPYVAKQFARDREYVKAWESAPEDWKRQAADAGLEPCVENPMSMAMLYDEKRCENSYDIDMAVELDTELDSLIEQFGHEYVVKGVYEKLTRTMQEEIMRAKAEGLGKILFYLVRSETRNVKAVIYSALHAIPRLAAANGISSMRESARICNVSPEWIRKCRNEICDLLGIPVPQEGTKSFDARQKYTENALRNHWRKQTTNTNQKPSCKHQHQQQQQQQKSLPLLRAIARRLRSRSPASQSETT